MRQIVGLVWLACLAAAFVQQSFSTSETKTGEYQFNWPIQKVAIIGAGPSGLVAYRELKEAGLDVRIFERDSVPGGIWHYTEEIPFDTPVPNVPAPIGDFVPSLPPMGVDLPYSEEFEDDGDLRRDHRGPKPIWESLTSILPSALQEFRQWPWPAGTPWELSQYQIRNYVRSYASYLNINSNDDNPAITYNTRVEHVEKRLNASGQEQGWKLWLRSLETTQNDKYRVTWWTEDFDAVVVAVGRYNAPSMPSIPGLAEWVQKFPDLVRHSRQYRRPEAYVNQTVLIVGAAASGSAISRDMNHHARKIYQSFRADNDNHTHFALENHLRRLPINTTLVGEIKHFLPIPDGSSIQSGHVELMNGTILSGINSVLFATGFRYSFPFLPQYYDGAAYQPHAGSSPIVSPFLPLDGSHIRDLYLDLFYLRDPTLAFLNFPLGIQSFLLSEYTTLALAKVWTNTAKLPNTQMMRALYDKGVEERGGYSKHLLFWGPQRSAAMYAHLIGWLNEAAAKYGGKQVDGIPKSIRDINHYWQIAYYGGPVEVKGPKAVPTSLGRGGYDDILVYDGRELEWSPPTCFENGS